MIQCKCIFGKSCLVCRSLSRRWAKHTLWRLVKNLEVRDLNARGYRLTAILILMIRPAILHTVLQNGASDACSVRIKALEINKTSIT